MSDTEPAGGRGEKPPSLADRINRLFEVAHGPGGRAPSTRTVADGVSGQGTPISEAALYYLRTGSRSNPSKTQLEGLARYFGVPVAYFFDDDPAALKLYEELEVVIAMRDSETRALTLRASRVTPAMRRWMIETLDRLDVVRPGDEPDGNPEPDAKREEGPS